MEAEELRPIVLQILKNFPAQTSLQIVTLTNAVEDFCARKGIYPEHTGTIRNTSFSRRAAMGPWHLRRAYPVSRGEIPRCFARGSSLK